MSVSCLRLRPYRPGQTRYSHARIWRSYLPKAAPCRYHSTDTTAPFTPPPPSAATSSVSQDEVSHFTKLASSWWDPHGPSRLLHLMNPLRHDFIQSCLRSDMTPDLDQDTALQKHTQTQTKLNYLDIGCGGGIFATSAARLPSTQSVTAIDPTPSVIQVAQAKQRTDPSLSEPKLRYLNCAIEDLESHKASNHDVGNDAVSNGNRNSNGNGNVSAYDVITLFEVIEHITQPTAFLTQALNHLKPGGWLIGSTIARHPIAYVTTKLVAEAPVIGVVPAGTHDWNQYINPDELKGWFTQRNRTAREDGRADEWGGVRIQGVVYVPGLGWRVVNGSERYGNYFFGVRKLPLSGS